MYVNEKKTGLEIAQFFGIGRTTVSRYIDRYGLERRGVSEARKYKYWGMTDEGKKKMSERLKGKYGQDHPGYKGTSFTLVKGYRRVNREGKRVLEHRYIMEKHLGRPLTDDEDVHHINKIRGDNRIENLQLMTKREHMQHHWNTENKSEVLSKAKKEKRQSN